MSTKTGRENEAGGGACVVCGRPEKEHPMPTAADLMTARDCDWVADLMAIERDVVLPILALVGMDRGSIGSDRLRKAALMVWEWR